MDSSVEHLAGPSNEAPREQDAPRSTDDLRCELLSLMSQMRTELQKFSVSYSRAAGGAAADAYRGQGRALALLAEHGQMRQRDMCSELGVRPQSLGEVLAKLERGGYITREHSENDRRSLIVTITDAGKRMVSNREPSQLFSSFSGGELETFVSLLRRAVLDTHSRRMSLDAEIEADSPASRPNGGTSAD